VFADRCVAGITANVDRARAYAEGSPSLATALNPYLGYEESASIAKQALGDGTTIRQVVLERGHVAAGRISADDLDRVLDVLRMTGAEPTR
jgi:fumarate hydratase class II